MPDGTEIVFDVAAPLFTRRVVHIARAVGDCAGYLGPWMLGIAATNIAGRVAFSLSRNMFAWMDRQPLARDHPDYHSMTVATRAELEQMPGHITRRLTSRLLRALTVGDNYERFLTDVS
jgi:hypothetical protein